MSVVSVVCCQVEVCVCAAGRSLVQKSSTECGVSECHHEASIMRRPWTTRGCCAMENKDCGGVILVYHWARRCVIVTVSGVCLHAHICAFGGRLLDVTVDSGVLGRFVRTENWLLLECNGHSVMTRKGISSVAKIWRLMLNYPRLWERCAWIFSYIGDATLCVLVNSYPTFREKLAPSLG